MAQIHLVRPLGTEKVKNGLSLSKLLKCTRPSLRLSESARQVDTLESKETQHTHNKEVKLMSLHYKTGWHYIESSQKGSEELRGSGEPLEIYSYWELMSCQQTIYLHPQLAEARFFHSRSDPSNSHQLGHLTLLHPNQSLSIIRSQTRIHDSYSFFFPFQT